MIKKISHLASLPLIFILNACGGSSSTSVSTSSSDLEAYLLGSSAIEGVEYTCSDDLTINSKTTSTGMFRYTNHCGLLTFKIGKLNLASIYISNIPIDNKLYITDLVASQRTDTNNIKVSNICRILQTLDEDKNSHNGIKISTTTFNNITNVYIKDLKDITNEDDLSSIIVDANIPKENLLTSNYALVHLEESLKEDGIYVDTQRPFIPSLDKDDFILEDTKKELFKIDNDQRTIISYSGSHIKLFAEANTYYYKNGINQNLTVSDYEIKHSYFMDDFNTSSIQGSYLDYNITTKDNTGKISDIFKLRVLKDNYTPSFDINDTYSYDYNISSNNTNIIVDINVSDADINTTNSDADGFVIYDIMTNTDIFDINSSGYLIFKNTQTSVNEYNVSIRITDFARHDLTKTFNIKVVE